MLGDDRLDIEGRVGSDLASYEPSLGTENICVAFQTLSQAVDDSREGRAVKGRIFTSSCSVEEFLMTKCRLIPEL
jgi:hypothetical protein